MGWLKNQTQQSYSCNSKKLSSLRRERNWTQAKLAKVAGYSLRLINKAESGRPISIEAVEVLAEALSTTNEKISPQDLIASPTTLSKEFIFGMYRHANLLIQHTSYFLDDNVLFRFSGDSKEIPFAGEYRGIDNVGIAFNIFYSVLESPVNHDPSKWYDFIEHDNDVVVWGKSWLHPIGRPLKKPVEVSILMRYEAGKLVLFDDRFDTETGKQVIRNARQAATQNSPGLRSSGL